MGSTHVCVILQHIETSQSGRSFLESLQEFCGSGSIGVGAILSRDTGSTTDNRNNESGELHDGQHTKRSGRRLDVGGKGRQPGTLENVRGGWRREPTH